MGEIPSKLGQCIIASKFRWTTLGAVQAPREGKKTFDGQERYDSDTIEKGRNAVLSCRNRRKVLTESHITGENSSRPYKYKSEHLICLINRWLA